MSERKCSVEGCDRDRKAGGLCNKHYERLRLRGTTADPVRTRPLCSVANCGRPLRGHTYCTLHYERWRRGKPMNDPPQVPHAERLSWLRDMATHTGHECLIWPYAKCSNGRGEITLDGVRMTPARAMCILAHGNPPFAGAQAAHGCGRGAEGCVHPEHLRWDTPIGNAADRIAHGTDLRGEKAPSAVLTDAEAAEIYRSTERTTDLASRFGCSRQVIADIRSGRRWKHVQ